MGIYRQKAAEMLGVPAEPKPRTKAMAVTPRERAMALGWVIDARPARFASGQWDAALAQVLLLRDVALS